MIKAYITALILMIFLLLSCIIRIKKRKDELSVQMRRLIRVAIETVIANIIYVASPCVEGVYFGFSLFSGMVYWLLFALYHFIALYSSTYNKKKLLHKFFFYAGIIDSVSFVINIFVHHVFTLSSKALPDGNLIYNAGNFGLFYYLHLAISYIIVAYISILLIGKAIASSGIIRRKYTVVLGVFAFVIGLDGMSVALHSPINVSILFYSLLAISLCYYALYYHPRQLIYYMQSMVMKNMTNGVVCFDENGKCIYANEGVWKLIPEEPDLTLLERYVYEGQKKKIDLDEPYLVWNEERMIDGEMRYFEFERQSMYDVRGKVIGSYFTMTDRTEQKRFYEMQVNAANESNRAKSEFLSRISHDIRTPVNSIYGMNEMIIRESNQDNVSQYAGQIKEAVEVLIDLINEVLDFSKIEAGKMELVEREYDTGKLLEALIHMVEIRAKKQNLTFSYHISPELPSVLFGDDVRIGQIINNLLSNATKYTPEGSVSLEIDCEIDGNDAVITVKVKDTGIGIKEEDIPKLFEAFQRIEEIKNHSIQGSGLGLNIVSHLLEMMNSTLQLESEYGKGSCFYFTICQRIVNAEKMRPIDSEKTEDKKPYVVKFKAPWVQILVVDDNRLNRRVFCNLLKETEVSIDQAESGEQCLKMICEKHYDMIFLDHMMPEMDGVEAFERMKNLPGNQCENVPVVMLTANALEGKREEYLAAGFTDFLAKPIVPEQLEEMIAKYVQIS